MSGDLISRQALLEDFGLSEKTRKWGGDHSGYNTMMLYEIQDIIESAPPVNPQEPKWNRLYSWLNDMRYGIAPDETVTDIDERNVRTAQVDLLDEIMEWMGEPQERSE